ncbi:uncharacterized protein LOC133147255 [Syngnathus typhle]|uniref:uncharacterized protein LOC133147255 n=1 Tax=Syngnathus typhle TaxID=161592 RepID=UPI002A6AED2C|nr:uncharacterized protein LOC133147255 [Syngnathus typhle]
MVTRSRVKAEAPSPSAPVADGSPNYMGAGVTEAYPMIQVANPHDDGGPTILVYRTWTHADVKSATEGIALPSEDVEQYCTDMMQLIASYNLRGDEVQQVFMATLTKDWASVKGNWDPFDENGRPLEYNGLPLRNQIEQLLGRIKTKFQRRANYAEIGRTKQKEDELFEDYRHRLEKVFKANSGLEPGTEVYNQQLKNALHTNSRPAIQNWVVKHMITFPTSTLPQFIDHAMHAEKVVNLKKGKEKGKVATIFFADKDSHDAFYQNKTFEPYQKKHGRGNFRGKGRGGYRHGALGYGPTGQPKQPSTQPPVCWACGKEGHIAKYCPDPHKSGADPPL